MVDPKNLSETGPRLVVEYKNKRAIDLLDLTASLAALGEQFRRGVASHEPTVVEPRLLIQKLETGSIIAQLVPYIEQVDFLLRHRDLLGGFVAQWGDILSLITRYEPAAKSIDKPSVRAARTFVQPIAKDNGAQLNITVADGGQIINNFHIGSNAAETLVRHAGQLLSADYPGEIPFEEEPLLLYQMRDSLSAGNMGFIDRFSTKAKKLQWANDNVKDAVLHGPNNPFDQVFFVSGTVKTAGGSVAAYLIRDVIAATPRE